MKVVRLNTNQFRQWRGNKPFLVSESGEPKRELSLQEERVTSELADQAKRTRSTIEKEFESLTKGGSTIKVKCVAESFGSSGETVLVKTYVDGLLKVPSRQLIKARLLKDHGECQVRGPNNVVIATVRDPKVTRPTPKDALRTAPPPENCQCKDWGEPHPGMHHPICQYNKIAPIDEQALSTRVSEKQLVEVPKGKSPAIDPNAQSVGEPIGESVGEPVGEPTAELVEKSEPHAPDKCPNGCLNWAWPPGTVKPVADIEHHPICQFADAWESHARVAMYVCELDSGKAVRKASKEEVAESVLSERRTGAPTINLGGGESKEVYVVLPESEADLSSLLSETVQEPLKAEESKPETTQEATPS